MPITPRGGLSFTITTGGSPVRVVPPLAGGGYIVNPLTAADQGIGTAEPLIIDPINPPGLTGNNTSVAIPPGGWYSLIPDSTLSVWANALTNGHKFTVVYWLPPT